MKRYIVFFLAAFLFSQQVSVVNAEERAAAQPSPTDIQPMRPITTTVIVVRHAEKDMNWSGEDKTCPLTKDGEKRAETLKYIANMFGVSVVYSTKTTRTIETVNNYAGWKNIPITFYNSYDQLVDDIKKNCKGKVVLVAGHSPTVPTIIKKLGISSSVPEANYNDLFIVTITTSPFLPVTSISLFPMTYDFMRH